MHTPDPAANPPHPRPRGMTAYILISLGQMISMLGSAMSSFAVGVWAWKLTGQATPLALVAVFSTVPLLLFSPFAGAIVDRRPNKKLVMLLSDLASALVTLAYLLLSASGRLQIWHLYAGAAFAGCFTSFQWPAYTSATALMLPPDQYSRAAGISSLVTTGSGLLAPLLAGTLFGIIGLPGIFLIDLLTFSAAVLTLLWIALPSAPISQTTPPSISNLWREAGSGLQYILARPNLLALQAIFSLGNFAFNLSGILVTPMILARTHADTVILGLVASAASVGGICGGLLMSAWKGPRRKIDGVLLGWLGLGLAAVLPFSANAGPPVWIAASLFSAFIPTLIDSSHQAIWLSKIPPEMQGRIASIRLVIAYLLAPLALLAAGPLADRLLEPAMLVPTGFLPRAFGWLTGSGPGAGMGLVFLFCSLCIFALAILGYSIPAVRNVETLIPDQPFTPP